MSENKSRKFLIHGGILAMAAIIVRIIGMVYRIPLVNIIGSEGTGVYSIAYNIYAIMLILSANALPSVASKMMAAKLATKEYKSANQIFNYSFLVAVISGGVAAAFMFFGADFIESLYKGVPGVAIPIRVLAPTVFFVSVLGVMRGFYQAQGTMIPTSVSQIIEQIINAIVSVAAGYILVNIYKNSENVAAYGAAGSTLGTCLGALVSLLFLMGIYAVYRPVFMRMVRRDKISVLEPPKNVCREIIFTMIPIILSTTLYHASSVIDDMMFSNMMAGSGINIKMDIGNYSSSYILLIGIPQGIATAMSISMLPSVVSSYTIGDLSGVREKIQKTIKTNMLIVIPSVIGLAVLGKPIIQLLFASYDSNQGSMMLKIGAIAVLFYTLSTVTTSALQGIDKVSVPVKYSAIALAVHIVLVFCLLKFTDLGIFALVIGNATFPVIIFALNYVALYKYIGYKQELLESFGIPLICAVIMGVACGLTYKGVYAVSSSNIVSLIAAMAVAAVSYFGPVFVFVKKKLFRL